LCCMTGRSKPGLAPATAQSDAVHKGLTPVSGTNANARSDR
jgi:hypothetical protein